MTTTARPAGSNLVSLGLIQAFRLVSGLAINVMVMRGLGVAGFGIYGYVMILVGLASFGASMGMDRIIKREVARDHALAGRYVGTALATTGLLSIITTLGVLAWAWAVDGRPLVIGAAALASVAVGFRALALVPASYFHAIRRMRLGVPGSLVGRIVLVCGTAVLLAMQWDVIAVMSAQLLDGVVTFAVLWWVFRKLPTSPLRTSWRDIRALVRTAVPFGLNSLFVSLYLSLDVVLLQHWKGDSEVGVYRGAVMLLSLVTILAETLTTGIYPRMARYLGRPEDARAELRFTNRVLLGTSIPIAVGGMLVATPLMAFIGGQDFAASGLPFLVMAPMLPFRFLSNGYGMTLTALNRQPDRTRAALVAAVFNIALNLYMIPRHGALGAAMTTFLTELLFFLWMQWCVGRLLRGLGISGAILPVVLPVALMAGAITLLPPTHVTVAIAVGAVVYALAGRVTGVWSMADLRRLREV